MTDEEQLAAIKFTVDVVNHRVPGHCRCRFQRYRPRLRTGRKSLPNAAQTPC